MGDRFQLNTRRNYQLGLRRWGERAVQPPGTAGLWVPENSVFRKGDRCYRALAHFANSSDFIFFQERPENIIFFNVKFPNFFNIGRSIFFF